MTICQNHITSRFSDDADATPCTRPATHEVLWSPSNEGRWILVCEVHAKEFSAALEIAPARA